MLRELNFDVTFPTGKRFKQSLTFNQGLTCISGSNGKGKSLIVEMITYAMWGIEAVRGSSDDYKKCAVDLTFDVKGETYKVLRKGSSVTLARGTEIVATGTRPVNQKMAEIFSYPFAVFSVANLIGQGQIEALAMMKPVDRKKLIDNTVGLDALDEVIKWAGEEASTARKLAEALSAGLVEPEPPEPYEGESSGVIEAALVEFRKLKSEKDSLLGWLRTEPALPVAPCVPSVTEKTSEDVERYLSWLATKNALIKQIGEIGDAQYTIEQIEEFEEQGVWALQWEKYDHEVSQLPKEPPLTLEQIEQERERIEEFRLWMEAVARYERSAVVCPSCSHEFSPAMEKPAGDMEAPKFTIATLDSWEHDWNKLSNKPVTPSVPRPTITEFPSNLPWHRLNAMKAEDKAKLKERLNSITELGDPRPAYKEWEKFRKEEATYKALKVKYDDWQTSAHEVRNHVLLIGEVETKISNLEALLKTAQLYEEKTRIYGERFKHYTEQSTKVALSTQRAEAFKDAVARLRDLKLQVKSFLVPSINKVASHLIRLMTEGQDQELRSVIVDEEFDIMVDGQAYSTLNGAGKTVASLALRLALGQVLTNRVFSVLMCDEVDASCDEVRAEAVASCLRNLTGTIRQVLCVSHKNISGDHYIPL